MKIPNRTYDRWRRLQEEGDIAALAGLCGVSEARIYQILSTRAAKVEQVEKINEFFNERQRRMKAAVRPAEVDDQN